MPGEQKKVCIDVPYIDQSKLYPTGCESVSTVMLLRFLGIDITVDEFIEKYLEKKSFEERDGQVYGPDPHRYFCGSPYDDESFGCYAPVIREALEKIIGAEYTVTDETGMTTDELVEKYIDQGMPVIYWACINMRDPILYRVARMTHHNTGDKWCIYPMYDFAHPIEDAIEGISHSICTLEFEDHRPLYDWVVRELEYPHPPKQIEFAKLYLPNVVTGKRYIKKLVEQGIVDGWDDPRLVSIAALRRRGFTPESIKKFVELCGISKAQSSADYAMLEYCIREDLKAKAPRMMAILDPVKLVIDNYPEGQTEMLPVVNNPENEALGSREVPFGKELYIEREDFMEEPHKKNFRMLNCNELRLMSAYFVKCTGCVKDENGKVVEVHCTYDPESRGGNSPDGRKVKGTIHWVNAEQSVKAQVRLYENIIDEEKGVYNEDGSLNLNPNSLTTLTECRLEPAFAQAQAYDRFQFVRQGFFCVDYKDTKPGELVFNRIVSLKSSYVLPK